MSDDPVKVYMANGFLPRPINEYEMAELKEMVSTKAWKLMEDLFTLRAEKYSKIALQLNQDPNIRDEAIVRYNATKSITGFRENLKEASETGTILLEE